MVIPIRATWSSGAYNLQGANNAVLVRQLNTLKRELSHQNDQLLIDHQDEGIRPDWGNRRHRSHWSS
jgi:hypothetical protein